MATKTIHPISRTLLPTVFGASISAFLITLSTSHATIAFSPYSWLFWLGSTAILTLILQAHFITPHSKNKSIALISTAALVIAVMLVWLHVTPSWATNIDPISDKVTPWVALGLAGLCLLLTFLNLFLTKAHKTQS